MRRGKPVKGGRARLASLKEKSRARHDLAPEAPDPQTMIEAPPLRRGRLTMPAPLRGSYDSLVRQNEKTDADGLERIEDDDDLHDRIARKVLVPVPVSASLSINGNLPEDRRYCRPWTARFLSDLASAHGAQFARPLEVSSAVRTVAYQKRLMEVNGNAAPAEGDIASPHLTGATIDIAKQGMSRQEMAWMRTWLLLLQKAGKIDVEEEFQQSCFHITVYKEYAPPALAAKSRRARAGQRKAVAPANPAEIASRSRQTEPASTLPSQPSRPALMN